MAIQPPAKNRQQWLLSILLFSSLLFLSVYSVAVPYNFGDPYADAKEVPISEISKGYAEGTLEKITIRDNKVFAVSGSGGAVLRSYKEDGDSVAELGWNDPTNPTIVEIEDNETSNLFLAILPDLLFFLLVIGGVVWLFRGIARSQNNAMAFGKSKARIADVRQVKTRFKDVAGCEEAKEDLIEVVDFLKNPKKYLSIGAKIPKGVLLVGPPGTGKTMLARAVAGEANVPFDAISGSDFVEMYVGVGASRVRKFCYKGQEMGRCILFIDEIDAIGGKRGNSTSGADREYHQTLDALLVEMDGFEKSPGVVFIGATNRPDMLDEALIRPGRFDSRVYVPRPDKYGRKAILQVHIRKQKVALADDVNLETIAQATQGFTGADLENLVNQATIIALHDVPERDQVKQKDFIEAKDKVLLGPENKSRKRRDEDIRTAAHHEAGHALIAALLQYARPIEKATIVSRGKTGGGVYFLQEEDDQMSEKEQLIAELTVLMGGRAAEQQFLGTITSGAEKDISVAVIDIATNMVCRWGMSDLGPIAINIGSDRSSHVVNALSEIKKQKIDEAIDQLIKNAETTASQILEKHADLYRQVVDLLIKEETVDGQEIYNIVGNLRNSERA